VLVQLIYDINDQHQVESARIVFEQLAANGRVAVINGKVCKKWNRKIERVGEIAFLAVCPHCGKPDLTELT